MFIYHSQTFDIQNVRPSNSVQFVTWFERGSFLEAVLKLLFSHSLKDLTRLSRLTVPLQKIVILKQKFSFTKKNKKQNISQIISRFRQLFRITDL
jgi:hypothetical protein